MEHSYLIDYADELLKDNNRSEKIKKAKERKRVAEHIAVAIIQGNVKRAIDLAEKYEFSPQDFAKLCARYNHEKHTKNTQA